MNGWSWKVPLLALALALASPAACRPSTGQTTDGGGDGDLGDGGDGDVDGDGDGDGDADGDGDGDTDGDADVDADVDNLCTDVIDLVFVLDVSSSMIFVLNQLEAQIGEVVTAANALAEDSHFGLVPYVDNHTLDETGELEGGLVHSQAATLQAAFRHYRENYTQPNRNPGDGLDGPTMQNPICEENALDALFAAANDFPWRENATRVIILATDDTFIERPDNYGDRDNDGLTDRTDFPREGDYPALTTLSEAVEALQASRVRVYTFTRLTPPGLLSPNRCGTPRRLPWAAIVNGWTAPYNGQDPIPTATDARNFDIDLVRTSALSLSATINEVVVDSYCNEPVY